MLRTDTRPTDASVLARRDACRPCCSLLRPTFRGPRPHHLPAVDRYSCRCCRSSVCWLRAAGGLLTRAPGAALALTAVLTAAAALGVAGRLPVGSDHGAYAGLPQVIAELRSQPADAIIYQHALGWHFDYYLFGAPQEHRWFGSGWQLADVAARMARQGRPQWLVLPAFEQEWADAARLPLAARGLALAEAERIQRTDGSVSFVLYRIAPVQEAGRWFAFGR